MTILTKFTGKFQRKSNLLIQKKKIARHDILLRVWPWENHSASLENLSFQTSPLRRRSFARNDCRQKSSADAFKIGSHDALFGDFYVVE